MLDGLAGIRKEEVKWQDAAGAATGGSGCWVQDKLSEALEKTGSGDRCDLRP